MKRLTIRARLTLVYGGLFLLAGARPARPSPTCWSQQLPRRRGRSGATTGARTGCPRSSGPAVDPARRDELLRRRRTRRAGQSATDTLNSLLTQGAIALVVVGVVAVAFGWLMAGRVLQPLHQITETARRIAGADAADRGLHERIALAGPRDEVKELADTFDAMLERLDQSFDGQRRFVANASHELRTPLALNRALVEVAITRPDASRRAAQQLGETLLAINARHERLIDGLLTLADSRERRSPSGRRSTWPTWPGTSPTRPRPRRPRPASTVDATLGPAPTSGDPVLLERLVQNLVENAVRHNVAGRAGCGCAPAVADGRAELNVTNTGPVVPPYEVETIFEPFRRLSRRAGRRRPGLRAGPVHRAGRSPGRTAARSSRRAARRRVG